MARKQHGFSDQIRQIIEDSPMTRYAICKAIDLDQATMTRFIQGKGGLSMRVLDDLADLLEFDAIRRKKPASKRRSK